MDADEDSDGVQDIYDKCPYMPQAWPLMHLAVRWMVMRMVFRIIWMMNWIPHLCLCYAHGVTVSDEGLLAILN